MQFFTSRQCLPQIKVPGTSQVRHFGGRPMKSTSPLLVSSTKPGKPKYPPSRLHGSQGQTTDIAIQSMSCKQKLAEGASGRTSVPPMTSCPDKHQGQKSSNSKGQQCGNTETVWVLAGPIKPLYHLRTISLPPDLLCEQIQHCYCLRQHPQCYTSFLS